MNTVTRMMKFGQVKIQWFVSCSTPGFHGEPCTLHVSRSGFPFGVNPEVPKSFESTEAAWAYEHGYLQEYHRRVWCLKHRQLHDGPTWRDSAGYEHKTFRGFCFESGSLEATI